MTREGYRRWQVVAVQAAVVAAVLLFWQFGPKLEFITDLMPFMDPFFISSPADAAVEVWNLVSGQTEPKMWPLLAKSAPSIAVGAGVGVLAGMLLGLVMSHFPLISRVVSPFMTAMNATPRLALVPIFIIVFGPTQTSSKIVTGFVVFLLTFFSAVAGGRTLPDEQLLNAYLLGASELGLLRVRWKYVTVWTFAILPNILSTAFVAGLLTEIISAAPGLGRMVRLSLERLDATRTVALVILLSLIGAGLARLGRIFARWRLHWNEVAGAP